MKKLTAIITAAFLTTASARKANTNYNDFLPNNTTKQVTDIQEREKIMIEGPIEIPDKTNDKNLDFTIKCKKYGLVYAVATPEGKDESAMEFIRSMIGKMHKKKLKFDNYRVKKVKVWGYYNDNNKTLELTDFAIIDKDGNDRYFLMI